jgi:hypothetical protein
MVLGKIINASTKNFLFKVKNSMLTITIKSGKHLLKLMLCTVAFLYVEEAKGQLYLGNGSSLYISPGEQIYINGNLDVLNGASIINNSSANINLTGVANINGEIDYNALGNQNILPFNHQALSIGGSGNKSLSSDVLIGNHLQLGGTAKLITGNYLLSLTGISSSIIGNALFGNNANSWIITGNGNAGVGNTGLGGLKISGIGATGRSGAVLFPVGPTTSYYNPVTLANTGADDDFAVTVDDQVVPGAPALESVTATWNISEAVPGGSNVTLVTQWNVADEAVSFVRSASGIVHSDGTTINYFASAGAASGANPYTQTGEGFTSFSPFGVTSNAAILPVNFLTVKGYKKGAFIQVDWVVAAEDDIKYYEVQKSLTGKNFKVVGQVTAIGNNSNQLNYGWPDIIPAAGINFYRIKSVGANGSYKYSRVVNVNYAAGISFISIYPNPVVNNKVALEFNNQKAGNYTISIISTAGAVVYKSKLLHNGANGSYTLQLPESLAREVYEMTIEGPAGYNTKLKLMVHH